MALAKFRTAQLLRKFVCAVALAGIAARLVTAFLATPYATVPWAVSSADGSVTFVICSVFQKKFDDEQDQPTPQDHNPAEHCPLCPTVAGNSWALTTDLDSFTVRQAQFTTLSYQTKSQRTISVRLARPQARGPPSIRT